MNAILKAVDPDSPYRHRREHSIVIRFGVGGWVEIDGERFELAGGAVFGENGVPHTATAAFEPGRRLPFP